MGFCLGLGLVVLNEDKAIDLDSVNGAGEPMEHEALGTRVGARVSKGVWLGDQLGLDSNCNMCMCMCVCLCACVLRATSQYDSCRC